MSDISSIPTLNDAAAAANASSASSELGEDAFLTLLTAQLQNQDPLNPVSNEDFVAQLAQFSSLEELMGISTGLEAVYLGITSMNNATMAGLVGAEVVAYGDSFTYSGEGEVDLHFDASSAASDVTLTVTNEDGDVVSTVDMGGVEQGEGSFTWDGTDDDGNQLPEGEYTFSFTGTDTEGNDVDVAELLMGTIDEMDYSSGVPLPSVDGALISLGDIIRLTNEKEDEVASS
jgi:flagellar basal-body rod modification protein FlgD